MASKMNTTASIVIAGPPAAIAFLIIAVWGRWVTALDLGLLAIFYSCTVFALTAGFHRLFTHRSFECKPWFRGMLGIFGCMAAEGPIYFWVATHRKHHLTSDTEDDPHSPHAFGAGFVAMLRGWWHAHTGWMLQVNPVEMLRHAGDLRRDRIAMWCDRYYWVWLVLGVAVPAGVGFAVEPTTQAALRGALWGGFVRIFLVQHVTWSINSLCHMYGKAPFDTHDQSRNNWFCAMLSFGEGWHNNHHACPYSARHGFLIGQMDATYRLIKLFEKMRIVWNVRLPNEAVIKRKLIFPEKLTPPDAVKT